MLIQVPITLLFFTIGFFFVLSSVVKQPVFEGNEGGWKGFNLIGIMIICSFAMYYSYEKRELLKNAISNQQLVTVKGKVANLKRYNAMESFDINGKKLVITYRGSYCFNSKKEILENQYLQITYVDLSKERWPWNTSKKCIISVKSLDSWSQVRIIFDPWNLSQLDKPKTERGRLG